MEISAKSGSETQREIESHFTPIHAAKLYKMPSMEQYTRIDSVVWGSRAKILSINEQDIVNNHDSRYCDWGKFAILSQQHAASQPHILSR